MSDAAAGDPRQEEGRPVNKQAPSVGRILVMAGFALSCFGLLLFLWISFGGSAPLKPQGFRVGVPMKEVIGIGKAADVRISGVPVGKVTDLVREADHTRVELELQRRYAPLPSDTRATLRRKTLLGEAYIELTPGSQEAPKLREGQDLAPGRVQPSIEVDELFLAFDPRTRGALRSWIRRWQASVDGRAPQISSTLAHLPGFVQEGEDLLGVLRSQAAATRTVIRDTGRAFGVVGRRGARVRELIDASRTALDASASREADLRATVRAFPPALRELRGTLASAQRLAVPLRPVLRDLRPAVRRLGPTLERAAVVGPELSRIASALDDVVAASRRGLPAASQLVRALGPLLDRVHPFGREAAPLTTLLLFYKKELANSWGKVGAAVQAKSTDPQTLDRIHYLRAVAVVQNETPVGATQRAPYSRPNAYLAPGGVDEFKSGIFKSFDCSHTSNAQQFPPLGGFGSCVAQGPVTFMGRTTAYPQVRASP